MPSPGSRRPADIGLIPDFDIIGLKNPGGSGAEPPPLRSTLFQGLIPSAEAAWGHRVFGTAGGFRGRGRPGWCAPVGVHRPGRRLLGGPRSLDLSSAFGVPPLVGPLVGACFRGFGSMGHRGSCDPESVACGASVRCG